MAAAFIDHFRQEGEETKQFTWFKKGNPGGKLKIAADHNCDPSQNMARDTRKKNAQFTVGKVAAKGKVSRR